MAEGVCEVDFVDPVQVAAARKATPEESNLRAAAEKFHAAIAYSRQRGNVEPDNDPSSKQHVAPVAALWTDR